MTTSSKEKAQLLANLFTEKMKVEAPSSPYLVWSNSAKTLSSRWR